MVMLNRSIRRTRVLTVAIFLVLWNPTAGNAADPFYDRLLQDGIRTYGRGDHTLAVKNLRLACFGLLDEPIVLARGLTYLALAQAEIGDASAFATTFERILEIEHKFQILFELDADLRPTFEAHLYRLIPIDVLNRSPAFQPVARRKLEEQIHTMAPAERRVELERLVAAEPESPTWGLLLAELKLDNGEFDDVLTISEQVLAHDPQLEGALCLRGRAGMATGACEQALVDLESCRDLVDSAELMAARLKCLVRLGDWQKASILLAEVPQDRQKKVPFRQLARDVKKGLKAESRAAASPPDTSVQDAAVQDETVRAAAAEKLPEQRDLSTADPISGSATAPNTGPDPTVAESSAPEVSAPEVPVLEAPVPGGESTADPTTWPPELTAEIERIRQLLPSGSREQLGEAFVAVRELADRYRQLTEPQHLAAEIAYRLSRWREAVTFFERGGEPSQPGRLFYLSVALYEAGDRAEARKVLERCLPSLEMTAFVRSYAGEILGSDHDDQAGPKDPGSLGTRR